jgi:hypothetical protein
MGFWHAPGTSALPAIPDVLLVSQRGYSCTFIITSGKITDSLHSAPAEKNAHR